MKNPTRKELRSLPTRGVLGGASTALLLLLASCGASGDTLDLGPDQGSCEEPKICPSIAARRPVITCLSPARIVPGQRFTLHLFGQYLQDQRGMASKVSLGGISGNGIAVSPCHLKREVLPEEVSRPGNLAVTVATSVAGGPESLPAYLLVKAP